jgi:hypothetical protein
MLGDMAIAYELAEHLVCHTCNPHAFIQRQRRESQWSRGHDAPENGGHSSQEKGASHHIWRR